MKKLRPEQRLILRLLSEEGSGRGTDAGSFDPAVDPAVDPDTLLKAALDNGVAPLIQTKLSHSGYTGDTDDRFRNAYLTALRNNIFQADETMRLLSFLVREGIEAIPLKGSIASELIFGDIALYPASDIDLLVRPEDLERTGELLLEAGYEGDALNGDLLTNHYHLTFSNRMHTVELHWNLVKRYFSAPPAFWWEGALKVEYQGGTITQLCRERYLLYAIFRLYDHGYRPLKFSIFVDGLIRKYGDEIGWEKFFSDCRACNMSRVAVFTLKLLNELLGTPVPDLIREEKITGYAILRKTALSALFGEPSRMHVKMSVYLLFLRGPLEMLRIGLRRALPTPGELRLRYRLDGRSKKIFLYYLLNLFMLLLRKTRCT